MKEKLNQKLINIIEYYNLINNNLLLSDSSLKRNNKNMISSYSGTKLQKLEKLKKNIQLIKNCELKKSATNIVFGDGNFNAKIMIIGEGPGANEDKEGKPFVGRAGKLLDKMLAAIKLDRTKVYISNVVNYRPPSNRKPTDLEIARYLPYLTTHISIINPKILVLLGSTALNTLIGDEEVISKARGKWTETEIGENQMWVIASFHPAFLMRQPEQKKLAWIDLKMIKEKLKSLKI
jgi:DNA polymerase